MAASGNVSIVSVRGSDDVHDRVCCLCSNEGMDVEAIDLCIDCEQYLCRSCSVQHGRFKAMRGHNVVKKDQAQNLSLSILAGSDTFDFECTVCAVNEKYLEAKVYCLDCGKYLCISCLGDHNRFGIAKEHNSKTVHDIRKEIQINPGNMVPKPLVEKIKDPEPFSCEKCKKKVDTPRQLWVCMNCDSHMLCRGCRQQHDYTNDGHSILHFQEYQVMYEQYGRSIISGSGKLMGPVCSECSVTGKATNPSILCTDCDKFACVYCQHNHNSHAMMSGSETQKLRSDFIAAMEDLKLYCSSCFNVDRKSFAVGYCLHCETFICTWCVKQHDTYFGQKEHRIMSLKEIRTREESFFEKTFRSTEDCSLYTCDYCKRKGIRTGAMFKCLDCKSNLCTVCLDFHEAADHKHNLKILLPADEKEDNVAYSKRTRSKLATTKTVEFFPKPVERYKYKLAMVAFDLGSSRSGYTSIAFSMIKDMTKGSFTKIHAIQSWLICNNNAEITKSCLLFDSDQNLRYFGEEALVEYRDLEKKEESGSWYFFYKYDRYLRDKNVTDNTKIPSENGKTMPAVDVFGALIKYLIKYFCSIPHNLILEEDIKFILLLAEEPSDSVVDMLENAAGKIGIAKDDLSLVSKQTSIINYTQMYELQGEELDGQLPDDFREPGKQFLVVDLSSDQTEVSVHERQEDGTVRDVSAHHFGEWGLKKCVTECLEIFPQLFGTALYNEFCETYPEWQSEMKRDIVSKFLASPYQSAGKVTLRVPVELCDLYEERAHERVVEAVRRLPKYLNVSFIGGKLRFDKSLFETIVESCITNNVTLVRTVLTKHRFTKINTVIFFGILLENQQVNKAITGTFNSAVLVSSRNGRGASIRAAVVSEFLKIERRSPYTYGINICQDFNADIHTSDHRLQVADAGDICQNVFKRYFMKGEKIFVGKPRYGRHRAFFPSQGKVTMHVLKSARREPKYADEDGIEEIGKICVDQGRDREVKIKMMFTETKLLVEASVIHYDSGGNKQLNRAYREHFATTF